MDGPFRDECVAGVGVEFGEEEIAIAEDVDAPGRERAELGGPVGVQDSQVGASGDVGSMLVPQPVIGHPKAAGGKQILPIAVVLKGAWLAHQLIDDVPIVDRVLVLLRKTFHPSILPQPDL